MLPQDPSTDASRLAQDDRGGEDVSSLLQIVFTLKNSKNLKNIFAVEFLECNFGANALY